MSISSSEVLLGVFCLGRRLSVWSAMVGDISQHGDNTGHLSNRGTGGSRPARACIRPDHCDCIRSSLKSNPRTSSPPRLHRAHSYED